MQGTVLRYYMVRHDENGVEGQAKSLMQRRLCSVNPTVKARMFNGKMLLCYIIRQDRTEPNGL